MMRKREFSQRLIGAVAAGITATPALDADATQAAHALQEEYSHAFGADYDSASVIGRSRLVSLKVKLVQAGLEFG